jgi:Ni,Fe-hydrogenase III small subunit
VLKILWNRLKQGKRTMPFPRGKQPVLPERYRGCPSGASNADMGRLTFSPDDEGVCYSGDFRLAANGRQDLVLNGEEKKLARALNREMLAVFGRSIKLRQVSAGGCNACEADINVLNTVGFDLSRFGIQFVASPRHADGLVVTGPVTRNMRDALLKTYEATPEPKLVIAVGTCAISGGIFAGSPETSAGLESLLPVDLFIPGCPPHPLTILDGFLRLLGKIKSKKS